MDTCLVSSWPAHCLRRVCEIMNRCLFALHAHATRGACSCSISKYLPTPVRVLSPTLHCSFSLPPQSPNRRNLHRRSQQSEAQPTHYWCQLRWPRRRRRPRQLPPCTSPALASLLSAYTPSSLDISLNHHGQPKDQGSKHQLLAIEDHRNCNS
jgi:hypothetical protein